MSSIRCKKIETLKIKNVKRKIGSLVGVRLLCKTVSMPQAVLMSQSVPNLREKRHFHTSETFRTLGCSKVSNNQFIGKPMIITCCGYCIPYLWK